MSEIDGTKANGLWTLVFVVSLLALSGWGAFAYNAKSSAAAHQELRQQLAELTVSRNELTAERSNAHAQLRAAREELASVRGTLSQITAERDEVKGRLAAALEQIANGRTAAGDAQVRETGSVRLPTKPAPSPAQTKGRSR